MKRYRAQLVIPRDDPGLFPLTIIADAYIASNMDERDKKRDELLADARDQIISDHINCTEKDCSARKLAAEIDAVL